MRIWERPVEEILAGGMATLPLAPIALVSSAQLPEVVRRMQQRFTQESDPADVASFWTSSFILMGLIYPTEFIKGLFQGIPAMRESATYQEILREGRRGRPRRRPRGRPKAGRPRGRSQENPDPASDQAFRPTQHVRKDRSNAWMIPKNSKALIDRIHKVSSWDELIGKP